MRVAVPILLTDEQRAKLSLYARGRSVAQRVVERVGIVLQAAEGKQDREIAATLQIGRHTVARWRARFLESGLAGIEKDAPRPAECARLTQKKSFGKLLKRSPTTRQIGVPEAWRTPWALAHPAFDEFGRRTD